MFSQIKKALQNYSKRKRTVLMSVFNTNLLFLFSVRDQIFKDLEVFILNVTSIYLLFFFPDGGGGNFATVNSSIYFREHQEQKYDLTKPPPPPPIFPFWTKIENSIHFYPLLTLILYILFEFLNFKTLKSKRFILSVSHKLFICWYFQNMKVLKA